MKIGIYKSHGQWGARGLLILIHHVKRAISLIWYKFTGHCLLTLDLTIYNTLFLLYFCLDWLWGRRRNSSGKQGMEEDWCGHHLSAWIQLLILRHPSLYIQTKSGVFLCIYCSSLRDSQIPLGFLFTSFFWPIIREHIHILCHRPDAARLSKKKPAIFIFT